MPRITLFTKMMVLIIVMLIPIVLLYFYSNKTSTDVIRSELNQSNINQLIFFQNQVNTNFETLATWANVLIEDPDISDLKDIIEYERYLSLDRINLVKRIQKKIRIQENSSDWKTRLYVYSSALERQISADNVTSYNKDDLQERIEQGHGWKVLNTRGSEQTQFVFSWFTVAPYSSLLNSASPSVIIEIQFSNVNIENMLDDFRSDGRRDPFFYKSDTGSIFNRTSDQKLASQLIKALEEEPLQPIENRTVKIDDEDYLVNFVLSESTGWYLIDYMPLSDIMHPIDRSNQLFYIAIGCLLLMSFLAAYLLYSGVQIPLKQLVRGFQRLKNSDYSVRMVPKGNSEFSFVFTRFNLMVAQIQELFEKVYMEKIHVREARLKQLQSQINPHFFYNCFSFISSMAKLKDYEAVVKMSQNLSKYYRYTTRQERDVVPLTDELQFVISYLEIQKMRMKRLEYEVNIPDDIHDLLVPPLLIQPLVENAVIHGIESHMKTGFIQITGEQDDDEIRIIVEDNGIGMDEVSIRALLWKLEEPLEEEMGCGLWNVHQRMMLRFGRPSGVELACSSLGGLKVILRWRG